MNKLVKVTLSALLLVCLSNATNFNLPEQNKNLVEGSGMQQVVNSDPL